LPRHFPDTPALREDFARYYDEIGRLDGEVATILGVLEKRGFADNTIVIFMGDNGGALLRGKGTLYELGCHVPLIVRWPGKVKPGSSSAELISGEDLTPTFLEAAGTPVPKEITGRSFLNLLRGERYEGRKYVFTERSAHGQSLPRNSAAFDLGRAATTRTHRLIYNALWQIPYSPVDFGGQAFWQELQEMNAAGKLAPEFARIYFSPTRPMRELYDLRNDPSEMNNLYGKPEVREIQDELLAALQEWMILERDYVPLPIGGVPRPQAKKARAKKQKA
jgi:arylsulfatase A-like enzyme